jgi:hypothetical protein
MKSLSLLLCILLTSSVACTVRYSQSLAGRLPERAGEEVQSTDRGFSVMNIGLVEPESAHEQVLAMLKDCRELHRVEIDYRELWFILFGFPRVTVTGSCVQ